MTITREIILSKLESDDRWVMRGVVAIYERQTADEQASEATAHSNGIGFNGADAAFGTSLAKQIIQRGSLSAKQVAAARKMIRKYASQLCRIAEAKQVKSVPVDASKVEAEERHNHCPTCGVQRCPDGCCCAC